MRPGLRTVPALLAAFVLLTTAAVGAVRDTPAAHREDWSDEELRVIESLRLDRLPPPRVDGSNRYEGHPAAVELGRELFFDVRLSANGAVACATCHDPERQFQDGRPVGIGVGIGTRRAMPIVGAGYGPWLFWDGRKDSLWSQALGPLEDSREHGANRLQIVRLVARNHRDAYVAVFGALPDTTGLSTDASPVGTPAQRAAWNAMDAATRDDVSRAFANVGKAIAAYEKTLRPAETRFDRYARRLSDATTAELDESERRGLRLFIGKGQCVSCHAGPLLTDQHFHNTGVPPRDVAQPDRGRAPAIAALISDEFNCLGRYSDAAADQCGELNFIAADDPRMEGAFKTPSLRGVARRAPYMHAGQFATLEEVVAHYAAAPDASVGRSELTRSPTRAHGPNASTARGSASRGSRPPIMLTAAERRDLIAFLRSL